MQRECVTVHLHLGQLTLKQTQVLNHLGSAMIQTGPGEHTKLNLDCIPSQLTSGFVARLTWMEIKWTTDSFRLSNVIWPSGSNYDHEASLFAAVVTQDLSNFLRTLPSQWVVSWSFTTVSAFVMWNVMHATLLVKITGRLPVGSGSGVNMWFLAGVSLFKKEKEKNNLCRPANFERKQYYTVKGQMYPKSDSELQLQLK